MEVIGDEVTMLPGEFSGAEAVHGEGGRVDADVSGDLIGGDPGVEGELLQDRDPHEAPIERRVEVRPAVSDNRRIPPPELDQGPVETA